MSRLISAPLDIEQFVGDGPLFELEVFSYFYDNGYPIETIEEAYTVIHDKIEEENTSHIVLKVETLAKPLDVADVAVDKTEKWVCDCRDFQFNRSVDLTERYLSEWETCQHIQAIDKAARAIADNNQETL